MNTTKHLHQKKGFTLIEIIVSLALFSVVITIAVGALLILIASNKQLQDEQSVLSNLSFALDSMTREIRTGTDYYCAASTGSTGNQIFDNDSTLTPGLSGDCSDSNDSNLAFHGIAFTEGGNSITGAGNSRIAYYFDQSNAKIYRRLSGADAESIVSDGIHIEDVQFYVTGSDETDGVQPKITIIIQAYNSEADADADAATRERAYVIQTTVTQRALDI